MTENMIATIISHLEYSKGQPRVLKFKLEKVREYLHEELVVHEDPSLPFGGDWHGPEGFVELMYKIKDFFPGFAFQLDDLVSNDVDKLAFKGRLTGNTAGGPFDIGIVEFWTLRDGKVVDILPIWQDIINLMQMHERGLQSGTE